MISGVVLGLGRVARARRPGGSRLMERPPRLVGLLRLRGSSLVVAGFLVVPSSRDVTRDQLRVRIVPGVLLGCEKARWVRDGRLPAVDDAFRDSLLREKLVRARHHRRRSVGPRRTFFIEGRFTGFGTDSFIAVAIVRFLLCGIW